jgi:hypothetical protein
LRLQCWSPSPDKRPSFSKLLGSRIFEEIIMETAVGDRLGRDMWKKSFSTKVSLIAPCTEYRGAA